MLYIIFKYGIEPVLILIGFGFEGLEKVSKDSKKGLITCNSIFEIRYFHSKCKFSN